MLKEIKAQIGAEYFVRTLKSSGRRVYLDEVQKNRLIFDVEQFCKVQGIDSKRCDFAVFLRNSNRKLCCILIELKRGALTASTVSEQLKGGANLIEDNFTGIDFELIPLVFVGNVDKLEIENLKKKRIPFRNKRYGIALGRCNKRNNLDSAIGKTFRAY